MAETTPLTYQTGNDVSAPLTAYNDHRLLMALPNALDGGTATMRAAKMKYLPQEDGESETAYANRLARSVLNNSYARTIEKLVGEVFKEDIALSEDVPEQFEELVKDIDNEGNNLSIFCSDFLSTGIHEGVAHVMVEYPQVVGNTVEDHKKVGARPYWVEIKPGNVIGWRTESRAGRTVLTQLRVKETVEVADGTYGVKDEKRIRLYEPGSYEVFVEDGDGKWVTARDEGGSELKGNTNLEYIPLVTLKLGKSLTEMTGTPCLSDLAWLNLTHWQSGSDQRNILHYARLVTYFGKLLEVDENGKVIFGANRLIHSDDKDADLKVVEHSGAAVEAGRNDLLDLESAMAMYGLSLMMPKTGTTTATEKAIDKAENNSALGGWVAKLASALEQLLAYTCQYLKVEADGQLIPNDDFNPAGGTEASVLVEGYKCGLLPRQLVVEELIARGVIGQEIDLADLEKMLESDQRQEAMNGAFQSFGESGQGAPPQEK
jgi:hypothetical protein